MSGQLCLMRFPPRRRCGTLPYRLIIWLGHGTWRVYIYKDIRSPCVPRVYCLSAVYNARSVLRWGGDRRAFGIRWHVYCTRDGGASYRLTDVLHGVKSLMAAGRWYVWSCTLAAMHAAVWWWRPELCIGLLMLHCGCSHNEMCQTQVRHTVNVRVHFVASSHSVLGVRHWTYLAFIWG